MGRWIQSWLDMSFITTHNHMQSYKWMHFIYFLVTREHRIQNASEEPETIESLILFENQCSL